MLPSLAMSLNEQTRKNRLYYGDNLAVLRGTDDEGRVLKETGPIYLHCNRQSRFERSDPHIFLTTY